MSKQTRNTVAYVLAIVVVGGWFHFDAQEAASPAPRPDSADQLRLKPIPFPNERALPVLISKRQV